MNSTYTLTEGNDALNRVLLMMRYELGKTLDENLVSEQIPDSRYETQYNKELVKKYTKPSDSMTFDEFMEEFRDSLTSTGMIALEAFLTSTGIGSIAVITAYSSLLIYDLYKGIVKGEWGWLNIVFDIISVITSGTLAPMLKGIKNVGVTSIEGLLSFLSKNKIWNKIYPYLIKIGEFIPKITNYVKSALNWLIEKTGYTWLKKLGNKITSVLETISTKISNYLTKETPKSTIKQGIKHAAVAGSVDYGLKKGIEYGIDKYIKYKEENSFEELQKDNIENYKKLILRDNPNLFKTIKSISIINNPNGSFKNFKINDVDYVFKPNSRGFVLIPLQSFQTSMDNIVITNYDKNWDYKKIGDNFYAKRKNDNTNKWILAKGNARESIKNNVYKIN